jgi:hypothetical protein
MDNFVRTATPCMNAYLGKHLYEKHTGKYISESDFIVLMVSCGFKYSKATGKLCCKVKSGLN